MQSLSLQWTGRFTFYQADDDGQVALRSVDFFYRTCHGNTTIRWTYESLTR